MKMEWAGGRSSRLCGPQLFRETWEPWKDLEQGRGVTDVGLNRFPVVAMEGRAGALGETRRYQWGR